jgi:hypothetical protein
MTHKEASKIARLWLSDKPDYIVDRVLYRVGRKYLTLISLYEGSAKQKIDLVEWAIARNTKETTLKNYYAEMEKSYTIRSIT